MQKVKKHLLLSVLAMILAGLTGHSFADTSSTTSQLIPSGHGVVITPSNIPCKQTKNDPHLVEYSCNTGDFGYGVVGEPNSGVRYDCGGNTCGPTITNFGTTSISTPGGSYNDKLIYTCQSTDGHDAFWFPYGHDAERSLDVYICATK